MALYNITVMPNNTCDNSELNFINAGQAERIITTMVMAVIGIGASCGNSIILAATVFKRRKHQQLQTRIIFGLVGSMAVADMSVGIFALPYHIYNLWFHKVTVTDIWCLLGFCLDVMLCMTSIFHIVMMGIDRYLAICKPLYHRSIPTGVMYVLMGISWIIPALFAFPVIFSKAHLNDNVQCLNCDTNWFTNIEFRIVGSLIGFCIPTFIICGLYVRIYQEIKKRTNNFSPENGIKITSIDKAATKTIGLILSCYLVSWTPFFVINLFFHLLDGHYLYRVQRICELWAYFNSIMNPLVYYRCNNCIKSAVRRLFDCTNRNKSKEYVYNIGSCNERSLVQRNIHSKNNLPCANSLDANRFI